MKGDYTKEVGISREELDKRFKMADELENEENKNI